MLSSRYVAGGALLLALLAPVSARADAVLLLGEAYGRFATFSPTGHAAVYLTRVCAESPVTLRRCAPGEEGAVISRYHGVGGVDWIAIPLMPYLYSVDRASDVPVAADRPSVSTLRDQYRRAHLRAVAPDTSDGRAPRGNWFQLVGSAYDRRIIAISIATSAAQDDELIAELNAATNAERFNLLFRNCADFARDLINRYYPKALRSSFLADLGLTTPKQIAKSVVEYAEVHPELELSVFAIPQINGSRPDSRSARGVLESLVKTKKYAVPLAIVQPWVPAGMAAGYLAAGRFNVDRLATRTYEPWDIEHRARQAATAR